MENTNWTHLWIYATEQFGNVIIELKAKIKFCFIIWNRLKDINEILTQFFFLTPCIWKRRGTCLYFHEENTLLKFVFLQFVKTYFFSKRWYLFSSKVEFFFLIGPIIGFLPIFYLLSNNLLYVAERVGRLRRRWKKVILPNLSKKSKLT